MRRRRLFTVLAVAVLGLLLIAWPRLARLYATVRLFDEDRIVANFSAMRESFFFQEVPNGGDARLWPKSDHGLQLPADFVWREQQVVVTEFLDETATTSLLVLHDGSLVFEAYFLGTHAEDLRISFSMAKSFLSALFGIAVGEGDITSIDAPVTDYVAALKGSAYDGVVIRDVLNMASGVAFDEDYLAFNSDINKMGRVLALGGSMDDYAASLSERQRPAGSKREYVSIDTHVLSMVLRAATGQSLADYFAAKLWRPLQPESDAYYLTDGEGVAFALGGLNMTTRDYARFGELFRLGGQWHNQQLVPTDWVRESTTNNAPASATGSPLGYGYQWWVPPDADGEFFAVGIYGQYIYVNPPRRTVIVKTSAHREFRSDGAAGIGIKLATIEMFRAIAAAADTEQN